MYEDTIANLLHDAAARIPVTSRLDEVQTGAAFEPAEGHRRRRIPAAAIAAALLAIAGVAFVVGRVGDDSYSTVVGAAAPVPAGAPEPGDVAPFVPAPPTWTGELGAALRPAGDRTGRWVRAAFAVTDGDMLRRPITVAAFDGTFAALYDADDAEDVVIDGDAYRKVQREQWAALFTSDEPKIMVTGPADADLAAVAEIARALDDRGQLTLALEGDPDGYSMVVGPQALAQDTPDRAGWASRDGTLSINDVSDSVDPLLYAAGTGADLEQVSVGGDPGWTGNRSTLRFLAWSPQPGVVFEIVTTDLDRSINDLAALAEATRAMPIADWHQQAPPSSANLPAAVERLANALDCTSIAVRPFDTPDGPRPDDAYDCKVGERSFGIFTYASASDAAAAFADLERRCAPAVTDDDWIIWANTNEGAALASEALGGRTSYVRDGC